MTSGTQPNRSQFSKATGKLCRTQNSSTQKKLSRRKCVVTVVIRITVVCTLEGADDAIPNLGGVIIIKDGTTDIKRCSNTLGGGDN